MDTTDGSQNGMDFIQSMDVSMEVIQISADRLEGLRTTCSTSASLTQQEIRSLETKLVRMFSELLVKKAKLRDRIPSITASTVELKQWLRVVGLSPESITICLQRLNTMEQLLERSDIELKDLLANNINSKDEEIRRLTNAINNLKMCRNAIENGKNEPDNLFWDSWDRHHHRNSTGGGAVASPRNHRNKQNIKTRHSPGTVIDHTVQSPSLISDGTHHNIMNSSIHGSVHTLTPSPSPPNSPAVINVGSNSNCNTLSGNKTNRKSGTPPPKKKHETLLQPSTPSHTTANNNLGGKLSNNTGGDITSSQQQIEQLPEKVLKSKYNTNEILQAQENNTIIQKARFNDTENDPFSPSHYYYYHQQQQQIDENNSNYGDQNNLQVPRSPCTPNIPIPTDPRQMKHMIQHRFTKVFKMRSTCDLCRKQMYFGLKCKDCKYRCHKDCESNVPPSCGCPKEFIDVFMQTILNNGSNTSPNLSNNRMELIDSGYFNSTGGRRNYHHHAKTQIHPDSSSPGSSCNSSSPSSPALFINHQQQQYNQHASGIHSAGGILNQIPTPSSSGIIHNKQISQFNFPDVTITNQSNTKLLHSGASSIYNNNTNQLNETKISTVTSNNSNISNAKININLQSNSNGNYNMSKQIIGNSNQIRPPLSELSDTHKSNDSDKTVSLSGSTSASTDSDRTPNRLDSTEEGESGHWLRQNSLSLKEWDIPYDDLHLKEKIGKGRFGTVHRAQWHGDVAVKLLKEDYLDDERTLEAFKLEVANFKKTRHENLVLFMGACMNPPYLAIVTSLCKGNTLYTYIHQRKEKFTINRSTLVAQQISQGMGYLHARGIYHKDLRTKNIFLENGKVIITDFGLFSSTKLLYCKLGLGVPNGWLCYLAPELMRTLTPYKPTDEILPFSKASDIYSFGTVWYELLCGEFPFKTQPPESIIWQVGRGMKQTLANLQTSRDVKEILMTCWSFQASDRPDFSKLLTLLERLPKKRLARSPSHPVSLSRSAESVF